MIVWTVSIWSGLAMVISLSLLAHTIWFVRKSEACRKEMIELSKRRNEQLVAQLDQIQLLREENNVLRAQLDAHEKGKAMTQTHSIGVGNLEFRIADSLIDALGRLASDKDHLRRVAIASKAASDAFAQSLGDPESRISAVEFIALGDIATHAGLEMMVRPDRSLDVMQTAHALALCCKAGLLDRDAFREAEAEDAGDDDGGDAA